MQQENPGIKDGFVKVLEEKKLGRICTSVHAG
jgi:hypothetical protein